MIKSIGFAFVAALTLAPSIARSQDAAAADSTPVLAPVDPLAWAVANADWGGMGGAQVDSLRKIVNGQVTAHQVSSSYTDPKTHAVMRVKCADPTNCIVCSKEAGKAATKLRTEISGSSANAQAQSSVYAALTTYANSRAQSLSQQAKWNELKNQQTVTQTTTSSDGETKTEVKTTKVESAADAELKRTAQIMQQLAASAQMQQQQQSQGSMVGSYVNAAVETLKKPEPATVLYAGQDPLQK